MELGRIILVDGDGVSPITLEHILRETDTVTVAANNEGATTKWSRHWADKRLPQTLQIELVPKIPQAADMALAFMAGKWIETHRLVEWLIVSNDRGFETLSKLLYFHGAANVAQLGLRLFDRYPQDGCTEEVSVGDVSRELDGFAHAIRKCASDVGVNNGAALHLPQIQKWAQKNSAQIPHNVRSVLGSRKATLRHLQKEGWVIKGDHVLVSAG